MTFASLCSVACVQDAISLFLALCAPDMSHGLERTIQIHFTAVLLSPSSSMMEDAVAVSEPPSLPSPVASELL